MDLTLPLECPHKLQSHSYDISVIFCPQKETQVVDSSV